MTLEDRKQAALVLLDAALLKAAQLEQLRREVRDLEEGVTIWNAKETRRRLSYRAARLASLEEVRDHFSFWLDAVITGDDLAGLDDIVHEAKCLLAYHKRAQKD